MIDYLEIQNYKMFEKLRLDGLGRVNLIVGKNNVGKTSLLEAIYLASANSFRRAMTEICLRRGVGLDWAVEKALNQFTGLTRYASVEPGGFAMGFSHQQGTDLYFSIRPLGEAMRIFRRRSSEAGSLEKMLGSLDPIGPEDLSSGGSQYIPTNGLNPEDRDRGWDRQVLFGRIVHIENALRLLMPEIQTVGLVQGGSKHRMPHITRLGDQQASALASHGEGMNRLFDLGFGLTASADSLLLVDEVENGLHYELHEQVCDFIFEVAVKLNVQVLLTTHSLDFTRAFARAAHKSSELGRLYRLTRQLGFLEAVDYTERELLIAAEQEIEVR